jgi:UDP-2,3-diacylglucosamine hydrolase
LFEYWVGDDDIADDYNQEIVSALILTKSGVELFWIAGNRDF